MDFSLLLLLACAATGMAISIYICGLAENLKFPLPKLGARLGAVDGARGYLAMFVLVHHFSIYHYMFLEGGGWNKPSRPLVDNLGSGSVTIFFMITGALFYPKTWGGIKSVNWRSLYISRFFRIIPLQTFTVGVISLIALLRVNFEIGSTWISFPARFALWLTSFSQPVLFGYKDTGIINALVLWSLWIEWKFYILVLPVISLMLSRFKKDVVRWIVPLIIIVLGVFFHHSDIYILKIGNYAIFGCGMIALLVSQGRLSALFQTKAAAIIAIFCFFVSIAIDAENNYTLFLLASFLLFTAIICGNSLFGLLRFKGSLVLGEISFSIYMLHGVILNIAFVPNVIFNSLPTNLRPLSLLAIMPIMAVVGIITFLTVERPGISVGRRLIDRVSDKRHRNLDTASTMAAP